MPFFEYIPQNWTEFKSVCDVFWLDHPWTVIAAPFCGLLGFLTLNRITFLENRAAVLTSLSAISLAVAATQLKEMRLSKYHPKTENYHVLAAVYGNLKAYSPRYFENRPYIGLESQTYKNYRIKMKRLRQTERYRRSRQRSRRANDDDRHVRESESNWKPVRSGERHDDGRYEYRWESKTSHIDSTRHYQYSYLSDDSLETVDIPEAELPKFSKYITKRTEYVNEEIPKKNPITIVDSYSTKFWGVPEKLPVLLVGYLTLDSQGRLSLKSNGLLYLTTDSLPTLIFKTRTEIALDWILFLASALALIWCGVVLATSAKNRLSAIRRTYDVTFPPLHQIPRAHANIANDDPARLDSEVSDDEVDQACLICLTNRRHYAVVPCGHLTLCHTCTQEFVRNRSKQCPVCRGGIREFVRVFD